MTVGTITSSAEASSSKLYKNVNKTANENSNNYWKKQFLLELSPSVPFLLNNDQPSSLSNGSKPGRYSMSRLSSSVPLFLSWAQLSHSSIHVLRGNNAAPVAINKTIGHTPGNNAMRTSSANGSSELTTGENLPGSPTMPMQRSPGASSIELFDASSPTATTTLSLQSSNKTAAPSTTENILTTSKRPVIIVYPTVSPESIVVPIISCIFGFPLLALLVICCLRRRAKLARERERRRNYDMQDHAVSLVRFSPIHRLSNRSSRAISLRPERSLSRGFPSLELDTVIEERSDQEHTQTDLLSPESPLDPQRFGEFNSS